MDEMRGRLRIRAALACGMLLLALAGCAGGGSAGKKAVGYQLEKPASGEEIAVLKTSMGEIKLRFFPDAAPKTVQNFKALAKKGYYNGVTFHRVIKDFMIQGGDPTGTGKGGGSSFGENFEDEFSESLFNIRGAVAMANRGPNTNGSQFFIDQASASAFEGWDQYQQIYDVYKKDPQAFTRQYGGCIDMSRITGEIKKLYQENGGSPHLDGAYNTAKTGHTVFAQVFEGMDVVDQIASVSVDSQDKPLSDVKIESVALEPYQK